MSLLSAQLPTDVSTYQYSPLSHYEIRIITLLPATTFDEDLTISLECRARDHASLQPSWGVYEAVSYAWGSDLEEETLEVAEAGAQSRLRVRQNVATMLRYLRHDNEALYLWIDAICINQQDIGEKSVQVGIMDSIYMQAARVLIWIGTDEETTCNENVLSTLCGGFSGAITGPNSIHKWMLTYGDQSVSRLQLLLKPEALRSSLRASTTSGLVGELTPDINDTIARLKYLDDLRTQLQYAPNNLPSTRSISKLLATLHSAQCLDARDRVYALNGICADPITVCYSWSPAYLYRHLAGRKITRAAEFLSYGAAFKSPTGRLPSWVPDWRVEPVFYPIASCQYFNYPFIAPGWKAPTLFGDTISHQGILVDKIATLGSPTSFSISLVELLQQFDEWSLVFRSSNEHKNAPSTDPQSLHEYMTATFTLGAVTDARLRYYPILRTFEGDNATLPKLSLYQEMRANSFKYFSYAGYVRHVMGGRRCFISERGNFGIVPNGAAVGDLIVAFPDSRMPIILRHLPGNAMASGTDITDEKRNSHAHRTTLIGDCYLHNHIKKGFTFPNDQLKTFLIS